jgi:hypothetical protein
MPPTTENTIQRHPKITIPNFGIQEYITNTRFFLTVYILCVIADLNKTNLFA